MIARCSVAGSLVAALILAAHLSPPDNTGEQLSAESRPVLSPAEQATLQLRELRDQRLESARCVAENYRTMFRRGEVTLPELMAKEAAVLDAEFHLATGKAARLAKREEQLALAKRQWECMARQVKAGEAAEHDAHESRVALLDAEIALLHERAK